MEECTTIPDAVAEGSLRRLSSTTCCECARRAPEPHRRMCAACAAEYVACVRRRRAAEFRLPFWQAAL